MKKITIFFLGGLLVLSTLVLAGDDPDQTVQIIPDDNQQVFPNSESRDACTLNKAVGTPTYYYNNFQEFMANATYFDPTVCGPNPYPFEISSVTFSLYDFAGLSWPTMVAVHVYEPVISGDPCSGPGQTICTQYVLCDSSNFSYPNIGTVTFSYPCCVDGPVFVGLQYLDSLLGPFPSIRYDDSAPDTCDNWFFDVAQWHEWYDFFDSPLPGYPIISVNGETPPNNCACYADADVNNDGTVLSVADHVFLVRYIQGEEDQLAVPYKADLNGDCVIDQLDAEVYESYFIYGMSVFDPYGGYPVPTCCDPDLTMGACCVDDICKMLHPDNCDLLTGEYQGDGVWCNPSLCDTCEGQSPGDVNSDGQLNIGDATYLINYMLSGGSAPDPLANGDPNGDCCMDLRDIAFIICMIPPHVGVTPVDCTCREVPICQENMRQPGDANGDSTHNVGDAVYMINFVFNEGPPPTPYLVMSGDANDDAQANVGDAVYIINYIFNEGPAPVAVGEWMAIRPCYHPDGYWMNE